MSQASLSCRAFVSGCSGHHLTPAERDFFKSTSPWGLILFKRNVLEPSQIKDLISEFREIVGRPNAPILIDQEGGRVQRLGPPHWRRYPAAQRYLEAARGDLLKAEELTRLGARLIAHDLHGLGITIDCAPALDLGFEGRTDAIGDRTFAREPDAVIRLGRAFAEGLLAGGILPAIKHMPGHGRAVVDSHKLLPKVDVPVSELIESDFAPFRALSDLPVGLTAHILFPHVDPDAPATLSVKVVQEVIRGMIGFDGLLLSDDISMEALQGDFKSRAAAFFAAGGDIALHCNGDLAEAEGVAAASPFLKDKTLERVERAFWWLKPAPEPFDPVDAAAKLDAALALV
jgi:beta-N-acetylhexosaminidase